jgi:DNA-binding transcriptional MocR family regulator
MEARVLVGHLGAWANGDGALKHKLGAALMNAVRDGLLPPGTKVPSERALANALRTSRTTVVGAYDLLRERGWLESRSGSGTRVSEHSPAVREARGSVQAAAVAASPLLGILTAAANADIVDFALGTPPPLLELGDALISPAAEQAALVRDRLYHPFGLPALRRAIAAECSRSGVPTTSQQVLVTNGAQQAIAICAALCLQPGDSVLVEDPTYFGALDVCRKRGARVTPLPVGRRGVEPAMVRDRIAATSARLVYLIPTFQNPTGAVMPAAARKEIARIAEDTGVPFIDDCTIADVVIDGRPPQPVAAHAPSAPIFTVGSLSKIVWPGLRVGWIRAPESWIQRLGRVKTALDLGSPPTTQAVAARLVDTLDAARNLRRLQLAARRDLLAALLRKHLPDWRFTEPAGGLFLWTELPDADARDFAQVALRHGVAVLAGPTMSATEDHTRFVRLPFFSEPDLLRVAVQRLTAAWKGYRSGPRERHVVTAVT